MKQETLCAFPVELFSTSDTGATCSKGACVCAIVTLPSRPPKYSLVCYNAQQVTFCVARMSYVDARNTSLGLILHATSGHISFTDDVDKRWSVYFTDAAQQTRFLASCGVAFYVLSGASVTSVFSYDVGLPSSSLHLELGDKAHTSFSSYELTEMDGRHSLGALGERRGDADGRTSPSPQQQPLYVFQPRASSVYLAEGCLGFEGNVVGMREDDVRVFVVPGGLIRRVSDSVVSVSTQGLVFVVRLVRVEHVRDEAASMVPVADNVQGVLPSVYATEEIDHANALVPARAEQLPMVAAGTPGSVGMPQAISSAVSSVPAFLSASGIPAEHMSLLRKVELGVNAALATSRDVRDVASIFSHDWQRYIERPKPSLLSNRALLEQVQRLVQEEEKTQEHLDQCDRAIQTLEARRKELQQRTDRALGDSQKLLAEKNGAAMKAMDERLERDRQLVRLKDALLVKRQEQEDLKRHIGALQRTVEASNEELRHVQSRLDIHHVTSASMAERLSAMQESLNEERRRNASLVSKLSATEEEMHKAQAQRRLAEGQLTTTRGLAERERVHYLQVMEDERSHRATDADVLRRDIVDELDARERQYHVDRQRLAEEQFMQGLRDGRAEGRRAAETDLLGHQDELRLNLQRAKTEVETRKEEVRRSIESAMALRRTLGGKVTELEEQLTFATRKQTHLQYRLAKWQTRSRTARDTVCQHWRELLSYITHPCTRDELLSMMEEVRAAEQASYASGDGDEGGDVVDGPVRVDIQFQQDLWKKSRACSVAQRQRWLYDDMMDLYVKGAYHHYDYEWVKPLTTAHDATLEAVAQLYAQTHGARALFDCCVEEAQGRWSVQQQWWSTFHQIEEWLAAQRTAQESLKGEEAVARDMLWKEYTRCGEAVMQLCASQLRAQVVLMQQEMHARDEVVSEEEGRRRHLPEEARHQWIVACLSALRLLEEAEEAARAGVEAEAYTSYSGLQFQFSYALRTARQRSLCHAEQQCLLADETEARQAVVKEEADAMMHWRLAVASTLASARAGTESQQEGPTTTTTTPTTSSVVATACGAPSPPLLGEVTSSNPAGSIPGAILPRTPSSPTPPVDLQALTVEDGALTCQREVLSLPHGASPPTSHSDTIAAPQYVNPSSPLPPLSLSPPPPAASAFDVADLPSPEWTHPGSGGGAPNRIEVAPAAAEMLFATLPPPLPQADEDNVSAEAISSSHGLGGVRDHCASASSAFQRCQRGTDSWGKPTAPIAEEWGGPPPLPPEVGGVCRQQASDLCRDSFSRGGTPSSFSSSSVSEAESSAEGVVLPTVSPLRSSPAEQEAGDVRRESSTERGRPYALGLDSSDVDGDASGFVASGQRPRQLQMGAPRGAIGSTSDHSASANQTKKTKLFESSSESEEDT